MNIPTAPFCAQCGAANEPQATICSVCAHPLHTPRTTNDATEHESLLAETLLKGRYRIIKAVGQGGMGKVYRAQDLELNDRAVAIKEMIVSGLRAWEVIEATEAFKREATLLAALQHPNLPTVFEHFEENGRWYMVMSFIPGETLEEYLKRTNRNRLPLNEVLDIGQQICTALSYLHSQQPPIIFRDVKPANIMRAPNGHIYLIDFGVARRFKPGQKKDTTPFGSIGYAPPEQFNKAQTTPQADIYALGATLHQLISGHEPDSAPFHFPPLPVANLNIPVELALLVKEMLEMDAKQRPDSMLIVREKLRAISVANAPIPIAPTFTLPKPARQKRKRILRTALALLVMVACLAGGGIIGDNIGASTVSGVISEPGPIPSLQAIATATAIQRAALPDPYPPQGTLALLDPLNQPNGWQIYADSDWGGGCTYKGDALQITQEKTGRAFDCNENNVYANFAFQVNMTILKGNCGGINFRGNKSNSQVYAFNVCSDGGFYLNVYTSNSTSNMLIENDASPAIKKGVRPNTIAVVANGNTFNLYINKQKIASISDSTYSSGTVGLFSNSYSSPTIVNYQDAMIWTLP